MIPGSVMQACSRCAAPGPPANLMAGLADSQPTGVLRVSPDLAVDSPRFGASLGISIGTRVAFSRLEGNPIPHQDFYL
jgi:hypothetical protein